MGKNCCIEARTRTLGIMSTDRRRPFTTEPLVTAVPFGERTRGRAVPILTAADKAALGAVGTVVRMPKGALVYRALARAANLYNIVEGALKTYQVLPDSSTHISGFHFPGDLVGMAEEGRYIETAEAIIPIVAYEIPQAEFQAVMTRDGGLAVRVICKLTDALRKKDSHALILDREDAVGKLAMFMLMLEGARQARGPGGTIYFPMTRVDVAKYVGLTIETVSRAFNLLETHAIVRFIDRHHFYVLDRARLEAMAAGTAETMPTVAPKKAGRRTRRKQAS